MNYFRSGVLLLMLSQPNHVPKCIPTLLEKSLAKSTIRPQTNALDKMQHGLLTPGL